MINAAEARELQKTSIRSIQAILDQLDGPIRAEAEKGLNVYACRDTERKLWTSVEAFRNVQPTSVQLAVIKELQKLGFKATFQSHGDSYVPRAYEDQDNPPKYQTWCVVIHW